MMIRRIFTVLGLAISIPLFVHAQSTWVDAPANPPGSNRPGPVWLQTVAPTPQTGSFSVSDSGAVGTTLTVGSNITVTNGDIYVLTNAKAIRVDRNSATSTLNVGNWATGATGFQLGVYGNLNVLGQGGINGTLNVTQICLLNDVCRTTWPTTTAPADVWVNTTGDSMTGNLSITVPGTLFNQRPLNVQNTGDGHAGYFVSNPLSNSIATVHIDNDRPDGRVLQTEGAMYLRHGTNTAQYIRVNHPNGSAFHLETNNPGGNVYMRNTAWNQSVRILGSEAFRIDSDSTIAGFDNAVYVLDRAGIGVSMIDKNFFGSGAHAALNVAGNSFFGGEIVAGFIDGVDNQSPSPWNQAKLQIESSSPYGAFIRAGAEWPDLYGTGLRVSNATYVGSDTIVTNKYIGVHGTAEGNGSSASQAIGVLGEANMGDTLQNGIGVVGRGNLRGSYGVYGEGTWGGVWGREIDTTAEGFLGYNGFGVFTYDRIASRAPNYQYKLEDSDNDKVWHLTTVGSGNFGIYEETPAGYATTGRLFIEAGGDVGIGVSAPTARLEVQGSTDPLLRLNATTGYNPAMHFTTNGTNRWYTWANGSDYSFNIGSPSKNPMLYMRQNPVDLWAFRILTDSQVPVYFEGKDSGGVLKYVQFNANTNAWNYTSDRSLKKDITDLTGSLETMMQLRPVSYRWRGTEQGPFYAGFIAQDVESVLPNLVTENPDGLKALATDALIPYMVQAIQELKAENDELRARVEALESR